MSGQTPTFSVSDFVASFNQSIDYAYPEVVIIGELSNFRISKSAWVYFDLKDDNASVKFFGHISKLPGPLQDGINLEVVGKPYLHPQFGFSIQFFAMKAVGKGSINKAKELLKQKLQKQGLFDADRKRLLPYAPEFVAIIGSSESAGYGDFMKVTKARWPILKSRLFDVNVQGVSAPEQIVSAISNAQQTKAEVLVVIRGGGSKDDLAAFDHESVVMAVAGSRIPTLVAIGHQRDVSLAELASDVMASTPSNAGEILVPDRRVEKSSLQTISNSLFSRLHALVLENRNSYIFQRNTIIYSLKSKFINAKTELNSLTQLVSAYDPSHALRKGYAIVRSQGKLIKTAKSLREVNNIEIEFMDGVTSLNVKRN